MTAWNYNIYTQSIESSCSLNYSSKLKNKVGIDHLIISQFTRIKSKQNIFYKYSPNMILKLINNIR